MSTAVDQQLGGGGDTAFASGEFVTADPVEPAVHSHAWTRQLDVPVAASPLEVVASLSISRRSVEGYVSPGVSSGDLNGDQFNDVVAPDAERVLVWMGDGAGGLGDAMVAYSSAPGDFATGVWTYDFDRDQDLDLLYGGWDGLTILMNDGRGGFTRSPDSFGIHQREDLLTSVNFTDLDGDGLVDLFVGYSARTFGFDVSSPVVAYQTALEDEFYLQQPDGRFLQLPNPRDPGEDRGYGWYALHSIPLDGGLLVLNDIGRRSTAQSAFYTFKDDALSAVWMREIFGVRMEGPMGGFCDFVQTPDQLACWISDVRSPTVLVRRGEDWLSAGQSLGITTNYYSWSMAFTDFDLDGDHDVAVTLGYPFAFGQPIAGLADIQGAGVQIFRQDGPRFVQIKLLSGHHILGATLADLDSDGQSELLVREANAYQFQPVDPFDGAIHVVRQSVTGPRVQVQFDVTCLDAEVSYAGLRRTFAPYTNTGSFGNGAYELAFAFREGEVLTIQPRVGAAIQVAPVANERVRVSCR